MGWFLAALSGTLAAFAHVTRFGDWHLPHLNFLAFFCWVPLFIAMSQSSLRRIIALSFVAGFFHYAISQYWLYTAIHNFGGLAKVSSIGVMLLLFVFLSFYFSLIFLISQYLHQKTHLPLLWLRPICWVAIEYLRHNIPANGYPWSHVAYTQSNFLTFIQSSDLLGVYLVTFLLILINELIFLFWLNRKDLKSSSLWKMSVPVLMIVLANFVYGFFSLNFYTAKKPYREFKVGVVQGNIPQDEKWNRAYHRRVLQTYQEGTKTLEQQGAELILWPEASLPISTFYDADRFSIALGNRKAPVLLGAITRSVKSQGPLALRAVYNSAMLIDSKQNILGYYHKSRLVPFGEYVPFKDLLFFARQLTVAVGNMQAGEVHEPIDYQDIPLGILICYEDVFPDIARNSVANGAKVLINMSNDAWYGYSSAAYQHQAFSQFRAIENRRALIRATNTGVSSLIAPTGEIKWQGDLYTHEVRLSNLPFYEGKSIYVMFGDILPQLSLVFIGALFVWLMFKKGNQKA
ncbi:MAG: apolipoprotein N-acyltransferase [Deltaproteobacteria bacterium]|nr:apolipoprotein N-acyltransferase [Deltaproteobacteria bacterium]